MGHCGSLVQAVVITSDIGGYQSLSAYVNEKVSVDIK